MKFNIDWHKDCYKNSEGSLKRKQQQCDMLNAEIDKAAKRLMLYAMQIELAEKEGKHSFDPEKYALGRLHVNEPIDLNSENILTIGYSFDCEITVETDSEEFEYLETARLRQTNIGPLFKNLGFSGDLVVCSKGATFTVGGEYHTTFSLRGVEE